MPIKYNVYLTQTAGQDTENIWNFIAADSRERATEFIITIEDKIETLEQFPKRCAIIPESEYLGIEYRHLILGEYRIIFRIVGKDVYIMRIINSAQLLKL